EAIGKRGMAIRSSCLSRHNERDSWRACIEYGQLIWISRGGAPRRAGPFSKTAVELVDRIPQTLVKTGDGNRTGLTGGRVDGDQAIERLRKCFLVRAIQPVSMPRLQRSYCSANRGDIHSWSNSLHS